MMFSDHLGQFSASLGCVLEKYSFIDEVFKDLKKRVIIVPCRFLFISLKIFSLVTFSASIVNQQKNAMFVCIVCSICL